MLTGRLRDPAGERPGLVTAIASAIGYVVVAAAFSGVLPVPSIGDDLVIVLSDLIAVVNTVALCLLLAGYWFVRRGRIRRHRTAMLSAFALILAFLVMYLLKVGGGFEKRLVIEQSQFLAAYAGVVKPVYLAMLAIHVLLSVLAVPVVIHAVVLGLTQDTDELAETRHPTVGRIAVYAWSLSLSLGVVTYFLLNHVYTWKPLH